MSASNIKIEEDSGKALSGIAPGEYVRIEVADTGTGMTDEVKQQIFEPFFTTKERGKGTGLGLATCYGIIRQNKGAIEVESVIGVGTSFAVFLPRYVGTGTEAKEETKKAVPLNGSETVLVVEDESAIRGMIARMLENSGYHVLTAESGEVALQLLSSEAGAPVTLIISDIIMPGIDGNEMARRAREIIEEVSVLFISGYSQDILGNRGIIDTEINYIQKPFTRDQLLGAVFEIFRTGAMS